MSQNINYGVSTLDLKDRLAINLNNIRSETQIGGRNRLENAIKTASSLQIQKGVSFAKMMPRDDRMYKLSAISFLRRQRRRGKTQTTYTF